MRKLLDLQMFSQTLEKSFTADSGDSDMNESQQVTVWFKTDDTYDIKQNISRGLVLLFISWRFSIKSSFGFGFLHQMGNEQQSLYINIKRGYKITFKFLVKKTQGFFFITWKKRATTQ